MSFAHDTDVLIAGAGLAGLSLAVHLLGSGTDGPRIVLCDARTSWPRDRTWCHWQVDPAGLDPFVDCISHRWTRWRVRDAQRTVTRECTRHPYVHVPADALYRAALERLAASPRVELHTGAAVRQLAAHEDGVVAQVEGLGTLRARLAFDSRPLPGTGLPAASAPGDVTLLQHFKGRFVRAERPVFEPGCVELMDFDVEQRHGLAFVYVLPFAADEALVEATWFSPALHADERTYDEVIDAWLERRCRGAGALETLDEERGVIPMTTASFAPDGDASGRLQRIGLAGGVARPSTGYAYLAVQRHAAAIAAALRGAPRGVPVVQPVRARYTELLDGVFLSWLARHPERAPALFADLFERVEPARLVRFLSEAGSWRDTLAVVRACPALSFMAEAARLPLRGAPG